MPCPFEGKRGFATRESRDEFIQNKLKEQQVDCKGGKAATTDITEKETKEDYLPQSEDDFPTSYQADLDVTKPLYFWQLFSILGKDPILEIVKAFYARVLVDEQDWFRLAFTQVTDEIDHHIKTQSAYWIDSFGGGKEYWGGSSRLNYHHYSNHAFAIMNAKGATRWLWHMKMAMSTYDFATKHKGDPRILPCIVEFLKTKVRTYSAEHEFEFDESMFKVEDFTFPPKNHPEPLETKE